MSQQLDHIAEVSKNARTTWFALLGVLLFAIIALGGVRDRDFFIADAGTQLPLVNIQVPTVAFFIATPLLILSIHAYFHLYLIKLWRALRPRGDADDARLDETAYPWLIADAALLVRRDAPRRTLGWMTQAVSLLFGWLAAPLVLFLFWVRSWAPHEPWLSLVLALLCALALAISAISLMLGRAFLRAAPDAPEPDWINATPLWLFLAGPAAALALGLYSWEKTEGLALRCPDWIKRPYCAAVGEPLLPVSLYPAQLQQAAIVKRPPDWVPRAEARRAFLADYAGMTRAEIDAALAAEPAPDWLEEADAAFAERRTARLQSLRKRDFRTGRPLIGAFGAAGPTDLRNADLSGAFLAGIQLSGVVEFEWTGEELSRTVDVAGAELRGATLDGAVLEGAALTNADLASGPCDRNARDDAQGSAPVGAALDCTSLRLAHLEGANLVRAALTGADLREATLTGANLGGATLTDTDLRGATLTGADLRGAILTGADLRGATLTGANLLAATLIDADLVRATLTDADLREVILTDADLVRAILTGANLVRAILTGADLRGATLSEAQLLAATLTDADLRGATLTGARLAGAIGDAGTRLPAVYPGLRLATCFRDPGRFRELLFRRRAAAAGMTVEAFIAAFVCSDDNPRRYIYGPTLNPHTR